MQQKQQHILS